MPTKRLWSSLKCSRSRVMALRWISRLFSRKTPMNKTLKFFKTSTWRVERWTLEMFLLTLGKFLATLLTLKIKLSQTHRLSKRCRSQKMWPRNKIRPHYRRLKLSSDPRPTPCLLKRPRLVPLLRLPRSCLNMRRLRGSTRLNRKNWQKSRNSKGLMMKTRVRRR